MNGGWGSDARPGAGSAVVLKRRHRRQELWARLCDGHRVPWLTTAEMRRRTGQLAASSMAGAAQWILSD